MLPNVINRIRLHNQNEKQTSTLKDKMLGLISMFLPVITLVRANTIIERKISDVKEKGSEKFEYMLGFENLGGDALKEYLTKTIDYRKALEEKAKTNVLGVTISVTLIIGISQVMNNNFAINTSLRVWIMVLSGYSLLSIILATIFSIDVLGKYNVIYDIFPVQVKDNFEMQISWNAELNNLMNRKRNNLLYASYTLIIHFLVSLCVIFVLLITPVHTAKTSLQKISDLQVEINSNLGELRELEQGQSMLINQINNMQDKGQSEKELFNKLENIQQSQNQILNRIKDILSSTEIKN